MIFVERSCRDRVRPLKIDPIVNVMEPVSFYVLVCKLPLL